MMKTVALALFVYSIAQNGYSQELKNETEKKVTLMNARAEKSVPQADPGTTYVNVNSSVTTEQTYSVDRTGVQRKHDKAYYQERLAYIDAMLEALETKENYLRSLPEEDALATENGWYDRARQSRERLSEERKEVLIKIGSPD